MAISFDNKNNSTEQLGVTSVTLSFTTGTLTNGILIVGISTRNSSNAAFTHASSVTYNGVSMTAVKQQDGPTYGNTRYITAELWRLVAPASGTHDIIVTFPSSVQRTVIGGISFSGVDQTSPIGRDRKSVV